MSECEVIVVGAGLSGLSCAKWLKENGVDVVVLEARDRVGGRSWTKKNANVDYVDMGASYLSQTQDYLLRMTQELGVQTYKVEDPLHLIYYRNGKSTRFSDAGNLPMSFLESLDLNNLFRAMDKMGEEIPAEAPWEAPRAQQWDRMTLKEFVDNTCYTQAARDFAGVSTNLSVSGDVWEGSLLWYLWFIKIFGGIKKKQKKRYFKVVGGTMQISEKITDVIGKDRVKLNHPVHQVIQTPEGTVTVKTLGGETFKSKYIILAMPPGIQNKIHYTPELPPLRNQLNQRMPVGTVMKCILYYKTAFWKEKGLCGSVIIPDPSDEHPIPYVFNDTKPDGTFPALIGFMFTERLCRLAEELTPAERMCRLSKSYAKVMDCPEALNPIHYEEKNWGEEQYSGGGYGSIMPPGFITSYGQVLREPVGNMYFAGSETAIAWTYFMDGAISAGERAAREVLHSMGKIPKHQIWVKEPKSGEVSELPHMDTFYEKHAPSAQSFMRVVKVCSVLTTVGGVYWAVRTFDINLSQWFNIYSIKF